MDFNDYQVESHKTAVYPEEIALAYASLGLAGEAGEVSNKVKKIFRDDGGVVTDERREQIKKELGGVLWYVAECCTVFGLNMGDVAADNVAQLKSRQKRGTLLGDGDDR